MRGKRAGRADLQEASGARPVWGQGSVSRLALPSGDYLALFIALPVLGGDGHI